MMIYQRKWWSKFTHALKWIIIIFYESPHEGSAHWAIPCEGSVKKSYVILNYQVPFNIHHISKTLIIFLFSRSNFESSRLILCAITKHLQWTSNLRMEKLMINKNSYDRHLSWTLVHPSPKWVPALTRM